jgi:hypothetical protein
MIHLETLLDVTTHLHGRKGFIICIQLNSAAVDVHPKFTKSMHDTCLQTYYFCSGGTELAIIIIIINLAVLES